MLPFTGWRCFQNSFNLIMLKKLALSIIEMIHCIVIASPKNITITPVILLSVENFPLSKTRVQVSESSNIILIPKANEPAIIELNNSFQVVRGLYLVTSIVTKVIKDIREKIINKDRTNGPKYGTVSPRARRRKTEKKYGNS